MGSCQGGCIAELWVQQVLSLPLAKSVFLTLESQLES